MAEETQYGLIAGDNRINELAKQIKTINDAIAKGTYVPKNADDPNFTAPNKTVRVPQFSDAYNNLIALRNSLESEQAKIAKQLATVAQNYKPLAGPQSDVTKKELQLQKKYAATTTATPAATTPTTTTRTTATFVPPVPMGVVPQQPTTDKAPDTTEQMDGSGTTPGFKTSVTKQQVTDELAKQGLESTPENRAMVRQQLETGKTAAPVYQAGWEDSVRRDYSKYSWMLDELDRTKYKDVFDLLAEAVNPETKITDPALFQTRFEGTTWYRELATQQMGRKVRAQVGALSFDSANYAKLLNSAMRFGWEGATLKAETYREVFRRNNDGTFANPNAVGEARKSNDYLAIQTIGNAYLSPMSDDRIVDTLTGKTTQDDLVRIYREKAKVSNPHLAQAIDAGVTLEDIAYDYRKSASEVLGVPLAGIPLTEDFIGTALKGGEPGKPRLMTTNEWKYQLKSNPDYGYQFTANARKEVNDIVSNLEKAFGFVR
jgi:hypothetical protein